MIVLKIIGFVLLGILALIVIALSIKVRFFIEYSETDTNVRLQWLFLKIPIYPSKKDKNKSPVKAVNNKNTDKQLQEDNSPPSVEEKQEAVASEDTNTVEETNNSTEENVSDAQPAEKKKNNFLKTLYDAHGIDGLMLIVNRTFSYIGTFVGDLMHSLVIDELYMDVLCTRNDAASTAIYYGEVCSALFPMLGALVTKYKVRKYDINVYPDFLAKTSSASFAVSLHLYPIYMVAITLKLVFRLVFKVGLRLFGKLFFPSEKKGTHNKNKKAYSQEAAAK